MEMGRFPLGALGSRLAMDIVVVLCVLFTVPLPATCCLCSVSPCGTKRCIRFVFCAAFSALARTHRYMQLPPVVTMKQARSGRRNRMSVCLFGRQGQYQGSFRAYSAIAQHPNVKKQEIQTLRQSYEAFKDQTMQTATRHPVRLNQYNL